MGLTEAKSLLGRPCKVTVSCGAFFVLLLAWSVIANGPIY